MAVEVGAARQRIIRRPRLTSMLDESTAKVRMLIAPAGYGKTTLARQWLGEPERRDVWYRGGPASADVAALAAGIAEAASEIIPDAGKRMRDRLRATGHPEEDVDILAELFAEDVQKWPADAWLAIDDYHFAMESAASERFVDVLTQLTPLQVLIASRRRPTWATARRILYGEIFEIDRRELAMQDAEALEVLSTAPQQLLEVARGWPAVLGLVALNPHITASYATLPDTLYDFFAEELYSGLPPKYQASLGNLSFAVRFDRAFARGLLGDLAERTIEIGLSSGVLTEPNRNEFEFHPLLSELVQEKAFRGIVERKAAAARIGALLLDVSRWDDAFQLAVRFKLCDLIVSTFDAAFEELVDHGRIATLRHWLDAAAALHCQSPLLDLAEAEVAFQAGEHRKAESLAAHAGRRLGSHRLRSRAFARAGHGALFANRERESVEYFRRSAQVATDNRERREALYGLYMATSELELPDTARILDNFKKLDRGETTDDLLRGMVLTLIHAVRGGDIQEALAATESDMHVVERPANPALAASFFHALSQALSLGSYYDRALRASARLDELVSQHRLDFARAFAHIDRAVAQIGRREFGRAARDLESAHLALPPEGDAHLEGNLYAIRCRLLVAMGRADEAMALVPPTSARKRRSGPLAAEALISRGLAAACNSAHPMALQLADEARRTSARSVAVRILGAAVRSICATDAKKLDHARNAWSAAAETGNYDLLVTAYRGHTALLESLKDVADLKTLGEVVGRARDFNLARQCGVPAARANAPSSVLTPREAEVIALVAAGASNREVAQTLFIAEATVKVHLRHIYERLGARGRTEAVAKWLGRQAG